MIDREYLQIPKGMCAGNKDLFNRIKELIEADSDISVTDNGMVFTIVIRPKTEE